MIRLPSAVLFALTLIWLLVGWLTVDRLFNPRPQIYATSESVAIYDDRLHEDWEDWSWNTSILFDATQHVYAGERAISFLPRLYGGLYIHTSSAIDCEQECRLRFALKRTDHNEVIDLALYGNRSEMIGNPLPITDYWVEDAKPGWELYEVPLDVFPLAGQRVTGFALQLAKSDGPSDEVLYLDEVSIDFRLEFTDSETTTTADSSSGGMTTGVIYDSGLQPGWKVWSWDSRIEHEVVVDGKPSLSFTPDMRGGIIFFPTDPKAISYFDILNFSVKLSHQDQRLVLVVYGSDGQVLKKEQLTDGTKVNLWMKFEISIADFSGISGLGIQLVGGPKDLPIYIDAFVLHNNNESKATVTPTPENNLAVSPTPTEIPTQAPVSPSPAVTTGGGRYIVKGNKIYKDGQAIILKGVNWFGFDTGTHVPHGLWSRNWKDLITQMKSLGFNSVRVPVCPASARGAEVTSVDYALNPDLKGKNSQQVMDMVMQELNAQQMYILLDHHRPDCENITDLWYTDSYSEDQWVQDLVFMAKRYQDLEYFMGMDIKNEPKGPATWGTGNPKTDWNTAAEKAGKEILQANSSLLVFVQGIQSNPDCSSNDSHWWGGNLEPLNCRTINNGMIPANKLVLSPHVYGPDVWGQDYFSTSTFPNNMPEIWDRHFGFLADTQAIVPGEWGGKYGQGDPKDKVWQDSMVTYFISKGICSSYYWSFNPNSGDTGGILQDDWKSVRSDKLQLLQKLYSGCQ